MERDQRTRRGRTNAYCRRCGTPGAPGADPKASRHASARCELQFGPRAPALTAAHRERRAQEHAIFGQFKAVSDAVNIPIMVQDAPLSGVTLSVPFLVRMAKEIENVSYFKMETPFAADKLAALIEAGGKDIIGPFDGEEAVTLLADLDAGCTGTMTSALQPEKIRPILMQYRAGDIDKALDQWRLCLPLINHENRQCGLRAAKTVMMEGGVIKSDHVRVPLQPMSQRTKERLLQLSRELDVIALKWGK